MNEKKRAGEEEGIQILRTAALCKIMADAADQRKRRAYLHNALFNFSLKSWLFLLCWYALHALWMYILGHRHSAWIYTHTHSLSYFKKIRELGTNFPPYSKLVKREKIQAEWGSLFFLSLLSFCFVLQTINKKNGWKLHCWGMLIVTRCTMQNLTRKLRWSLHWKLPKEGTKYPALNTSTVQCR